MAKDNIKECRVSSVLNRDVKMYGKSYLFDESEETCWSSDQEYRALQESQFVFTHSTDTFPRCSKHMCLAQLEHWNQGTPQWIEVVFKEDCDISSLTIQFQGGFVGKNCYMDIHSGVGNVVNMPFFPEDINTSQTFPVESAQAKRIRIVFENSTDFFGRIVIYNLKFS